jgi:hypothetical protein
LLVPALGSDSFDQPSIASSDAIEWFERKTDIKDKLVELLLACRKISVRNQQDYFVPIQSPIMKLTSEFFPEVSKLPTEPDGGVRLSDVVDLIEKSKATKWTFKRAHARAKSSRIQKPKAERTNGKQLTFWPLTFSKWERWLEPESNQRHEDFQSSALPTELPGQEALL